MFNYIARYWWAFALRGAFAIIFGLMAVIWPTITLLVLAVVFGIYVLADAVLAGAAAFRAPAGGRGPLVLEAIAGLCFGVITLAWPGVTLLAITILIGVWAIVTGVTEIVTALQLRRETQAEWLYVISGAVSVLFGALVVIRPVSGVVAVGVLVGICAIGLGIAMIAIGVRLREVSHRDRPVTGGAGGPAHAAG